MRVCRIWHKVAMNETRPCLCCRGVQLVSVHRKVQALFTAAFQMGLRVAVLGPYQGHGDGNTPVRGFSATRRPCWCASMMSLDARVLRDVLRDLHNPRGSASSSVVFKSLLSRRTFTTLHDEHCMPDVCHTMMACPAALGNPSSSPKLNCPELL